MGKELTVRLTFFGKSKKISDSFMDIKGIVSHSFTQQHSAREIYIFGILVVFPDVLNVTANFKVCGQSCKSLDVKHTIIILFMYYFFGIFSIASTKISVFLLSK